MKHFLLRSLNRIGWSYAYLGLLYALYFVYFIVVPVYRENDEISSRKFFVFNLIFLYFFVQGYWYLILTSFTPIRSKQSSKRDFFCLICQKTIPIRDHHCFFVGRCIGEHNQRYFLLMLFHLFVAHLIGYAFVFKYLSIEIGGFSFRNFFKIPFFNVCYLIDFCSTKWEAFIAFHHYLVYFDLAFIGHLFVKILRRTRNGQTQYEEKKQIHRPKQNFRQIFRCRTPIRLLLPLLPNVE